jgi:transposase InsO family protein
MLLSTQDDSMGRRGYPGEFRQKVLDLIAAGRRVGDIARERWSTRLELANAIFEYVEIFHNCWRRHSSLSMLTPVEFETRRQPTPAA